MPLLHLRGGCSVELSPAIVVRILCVAGLYGSTDLEQAKSDMVVGCVEDLFHEMIKIYLAQGDEAKVRRGFLELR